MHDRINEALRDLIVQALKAAPHGQIRLPITLEAEDGGASQSVTLCIDGNSIAISISTPTSLAWEAGVAVTNENGQLRAFVWDHAHLKVAEGEPNGVFALTPEVAP